MKINSLDTSSMSKQLSAIIFFNFLKSIGTIEPSSNSMFFDIGMSSIFSTPSFLAFDKNIYDGIKKSDLSDSILISVRPLIEKDPNYSYVLARLLSNSMSEEAYTFLDIDSSDLTMSAREKSYPNYFTSYIKKGVELKHLDPELLNYDLEFLTKNIDLSRDMQFTYLGLQTF